MNTENTDTVEVTVKVPFLNIAIKSKLALDFNNIITWWYREASSFLMNYFRKKNNVSKKTHVCLCVCVYVK